MMKRVILLQKHSFSTQHLKFGFKLSALNTSRGFHINHHFKSILSEKDYELLNNDKQAPKNTSSETPDSQAQEAKPTIQTKESDSAENKLNSEAETAEYDEASFNNPFYRNVDEKTAKEFEDATNDKESTPFPDWMMNFYTYMAVGLIGLVVYGFGSAKYKEEEISKRYEILETKKRKREQQMEDLKLEIELSQMVREKKGIISSGMSTISHQDRK